MFGIMGVPKIKQTISVTGKAMQLEAVEPFLNDLYANAGLELPDEFNPVDEVIRVVETLRNQGKC
jgi:hypothetical protein